MKIKNVELETETKYSEGRETHDNLKLTVKIPGGFAIYEMLITKEFRESLEYANGLKS